MFADAHLRGPLAESVSYQSTIFHANAKDIEPCALGLGNKGMRSAQTSCLHLCSDQACRTLTPVFLSRLSTSSVNSSYIICEDFLPSLPSARRRTSSIHTWRDSSMCSWAKLGLRCSAAPAQQGSAYVNYAVEGCRPHAEGYEDVHLASQPVPLACMHTAVFLAHPSHHELLSSLAPRSYRICLATHILNAAM